MVTDLKIYWFDRFAEEYQNGMITCRLLLTTGDSHRSFFEHNDLQSKKSQSSCLLQAFPSAVIRPIMLLGKTASKSRNLSFCPPRGKPKWFILTSQRWNGSGKFVSSSSSRSIIMTASFNLFAHSGFESESANVVVGVSIGLVLAI